LENARMQNGRDREEKAGREIIAAIVAATMILLALLVWGPWNGAHVASNPGPSGTPGSTAAHETPPPAPSPSGGTTGSAR
jgi:hypothetical protein